MKNLSYILHENKNLPRWILKVIKRARLLEFMITFVATNLLTRHKHVKSLAIARKEVNLLASNCRTLFSLTIAVNDLSLEKKSFLV